MATDRQEFAPENSWYIIGPTIRCQNRALVRVFADKSYFEPKTIVCRSIWKSTPF